MASSSPWREHWFELPLPNRTRRLWRGVEAQHQVATLRLAETAADQQLLEELIEASKPTLPPGSEARHYLLNTPFRYRAPVESRFRRRLDPGAWYGAEDLRTSCAEVGYWRWRFLTDSDALVDQTVLTTHSFYQAQVQGRCLDLTRAPWNSAATQWRHGRDYRACQALGAEARQRAVAWIRYASARVVDGVCGAVFDAANLSLRQPLQVQTWICRTTHSQARLQRSSGDAESFEFAASAWQA